MYNESHHIIRNKCFEIRKRGTIAAIYRNAIRRRLNDADPRIPNPVPASARIPNGISETGWGHKRAFDSLLFVDGNYGPFVCVCFARRRRAKSICRWSGAGAGAVRGGGKSRVHEKRNAVFPEIFRTERIDWFARSLDPYSGCGVFWGFAFLCVTVDRFGGCCSWWWIRFGLWWVLCVWWSSNRRSESSVFDVLKFFGL